MDFLWVIIPIAVVAAVIIIFVFKSRSIKAYSAEDIVGDGKKLIQVVSQTTNMARSQDTGVTIPIERLPVTTEINEGSLFEITDHTVLARISQTIPAVASVAAKTITNKALKNVELYKAVIPSGATLAQSKQVEGAARGFYRGAKGIKGHADLVKVDPAKISKASLVASGVANVINVGSLVVGQYYMSEINSKLETMTKGLDKISDFQDREFKSRILSVIALVGEISQFSSEIIENDDQIKLKLISLDNLKANAAELLGQVNITISDITHKSPNPDYKDYQSKVDDFKKLVGYQDTLIAVFDEISKLTYLLGKGSISIERCYSSFNKYLELSVKTRCRLGQWHDKQAKALSIDLEKERIMKTGFEALVSAIPGLFDDKYKYNGLNQNLVNEIRTQAKTIPESSAKLKQVYDNDVEIIIKDGKYYYLLESPDGRLLLGG